MLPISELIIFARHRQDRCEASMCAASAGRESRDEVCTRDARPAESKGGSPLMRVWGMLSEEDEHAGFRLFLNEDWQVLLLCNGKTMAVFDPHEYTRVQLEEKVNQIIRVIRRNPFLVCSGRIHLCGN